MRHARRTHHGRARRKYAPRYKGASDGRSRPDHPEEHHDQLALDATESLDIDAAATVLDTSGHGAAVANVGPLLTDIDSDTRVGTTWSKGIVDLDRGAAVEGVLHASVVNQDPSATVSGGIDRTPFDVTTVTRSVTFPDSLAAGVRVAPGGSRALDPGGYSDANVLPRATLKLHSGTYYFDDVFVGPDATLELDKSGGPIFVYVRSKFDYHGSIIDKGGLQGDFLVGYLGKLPVSLHGPFVGTLVAPSARIDLKSVSTEHRGAFFGKTVSVDPGTKVRFLPFPSWLITAVTVDKTTACANEPFLVHVDADSAGSDKTLDVTIDGQPGTDRYVQFAGPPGPRHIAITAGLTGGSVSSRDLEVEIRDCGATGAKVPRVLTMPSIYHDNTIEFTIANLADLGVSAPSYVWTFGDGTTATTDSPFATHDYTDALQKDRDYTVFQANLHVVQAGVPDLVGPKTVTMFNMYEFAKKRGHLQPPATYDPQLSLSGSNLTGTATLKNPENEAIDLTRRRYELQFCDTSNDPTEMAPETVAVHLPALGSESVAISIPTSLIGAGICRVGVFLTGQAAVSGTESTVGLYFDVRQLGRHRLANPSKLAAIRAAIEGGLVPDPNHITDEELHTLVAQGKIAPFSATATSFLAPTPPVGDVCRDGNPPPRPGVSCQAASDLNGNPEMEERSAYIANALRGDAVLSHACGLIGALLHNVNPPQKYSHSGLMVGNNDLIRHSTASEDRIKDSIGSDGADPDTLKYGWPGTITQTVPQAFGGQVLVDPDGRARTVSSFNGLPTSCDGEALVYPRVLKASPDDGDAGRVPLRAAATAGATLSPSSHYRFWAYSRADLAAQDRAPATPSWATGTNGTMCASFIWTSFKANGTVLEGDQVEPGDFGASIPAGTPDGLYFYSVENRHAAANFLWTKVYNEVHAIAGSFGDLLTQASSQTANQVVNCFAKDDCSNSNDDHAWKDDLNAIGSGMSVSPDNLFYWDVYKHDEPMVYRQGDVARVFRWAPTADAGNLDGQVQMADGTTVTEATVTFAGLDTVSDGSGSFHFDAVPAGTYVLQGTKGIDGELWEGHKDVTITAASTANATVFLLPPPERFRSIQIVGNIHIEDDESFPDSDELFDAPIDKVFNLDPGHTTASFPFSQCVGAEVRAEFTINFTLKPDRSVVTVITSDLFEGTSCQTKDHEDGSSETLTIPKDGQATPGIHLLNKECDDPDCDRLDVSLTITNAQQAGH